MKSPKNRQWRSLMTTLRYSPHGVSILELWTPQNKKTDLLGNFGELVVNKVSLLLTEYPNSCISLHGTGLGRWPKAVYIGTY